MSLKNLEVYRFYKELPFNISGNEKLHTKQLKNFNPLEVYPELKRIISNYKKIKIIDFGCGAGWLVNSLSYHLGNKADVTGVDFNPTAIKYAKGIKNEMKLKSKFYTSDIASFSNKNKYDLIISLGVLHHTNDCVKAIKHISLYGNDNSSLFLGLYHKYGRKPFLDEFSKIKDEDEKFARYCELDSRFTDETHLRSWFRDQVLHPHETTHTMKEVTEVLEKNNMKLMWTSIRGEEEEYENMALEKLKNNEYWPGFFLFMAKKEI